MGKKTVLLAHNSFEFFQKLDCYFNHSELYSIRDYVNDGQELLNLGSLDGYDIVIVKNVLTHLTGLYALEKLKAKTNKYKQIQVLVITSIVNDFFIRKCESIGAYYIKDTDMVIERILEIMYNMEMKARINKNTFESQKQIISLLTQIGLLRTYIGYQYFEFILNVMFEKSEFIYKPMREIYQYIAEHFNVTTISVEKAMRSSIKLSFIKNYNFFARMLFGNSAAEKPSTSIFLQVCIKTLKEEKNMIITNNLQKSYRKI